MTAFVLGNGRSRDPISVDQLLRLGSVYGCNGLYRTHTPTVLVATDAPISQAIQATGYASRNRFYTRRPQPNSGAQQVPKKYHGFSSGPIAMAIAAQDGNAVIYLLGFDLGPTESGQFNNIYAGTEFYKPVHSAPTYTGNWVRQVQRVVQDFVATRFIRVHGSCTSAVPEFGSLPNLEAMEFADFVARINNPKDL